MNMPFQGEFFSPGAEVPEPWKPVYSGTNALQSLERTSGVCIEGTDETKIAWSYSPDLGDPWLELGRCSKPIPWTRFLYPFVVGAITSRREASEELFQKATAELRALEDDNLKRVELERRARDNDQLQAYLAGLPSKTRESIESSIFSGMRIVSTPLAPPNTIFLIDKKYAWDDLWYDQKMGSIALATPEGYVGASTPPRQNAAAWQIMCFACGQDRTVTVPVAEPPRENPVCLPCLQNRIAVYGPPTCISCGDGLVQKGAAYAYIPEGMIVGLRCWTCASTGRIPSRSGTYADIRRPRKERQEKDATAPPIRKFKTIE
jgi:hypothetical protein